MKRKSHAKEVTCIWSRSNRHIHEFIVILLMSYFPLLNCNLLLDSDWSKCGKKFISMNRAWLLSCKHFFGYDCRDSVKSYVIKLFYLEFVDHIIPFSILVIIVYNVKLVYVLLGAKLYPSMNYDRNNVSSLSNIDFKNSQKNNFYLQHVHAVIFVIFVMNLISIVRSNAIWLISNLKEKIRK